MAFMSPQRLMSRRSSHSDSAKPDYLRNEKPPRLNLGGFFRFKNLCPLDLSRFFSARERPRKRDNIRLRIILADRRLRL
jgi:hypothetical protein